MKAWIEALRLRTLPLSAAGVIIAAGLAGWYRCFRIEVFIPMLIMVLLLQILANFADEYGDLSHGADNDDRLGPIRGMQRGDITREQMKRAMIVVGALTALLILLLLYLSFGLGLWYYALVYIVLGALCIAASVAYTVGKHPYGYYALGDLSSFLFFGIIAVVGGFFLYAHQMIATVWLPAVGLGCLVVGVLNLNNMRDYESDKAAGKKTVPGLLGQKGAVLYHAALIALGIACFLSFPIVCGVTSWWRYAYVLMFIPLVMQLVDVVRIDDPKRYDTMMKPLSMGTAFLSLAFAICLAI